MTTLIPPPQPPPSALKRRPTRRDMLELLQTGRHLASNVSTCDPGGCHEGQGDSGDSGDSDASASLITTPVSSH